MLTQPTICVDYLSYTFNEQDCFECWKNITHSKTKIVNGYRLENATWRRFFQLKNKIPKLNPMTLNWQKETDELWLFGPFHQSVSMQQLPSPTKSPDPLLKSVLKRKDTKGLLHDWNKHFGKDKKQSSRSSLHIKFSSSVRQRVILSDDQLEEIFNDLELRIGIPRKTSPHSSSPSPRVSTLTTPTTQTPRESISPSSPPEHQLSLAQRMDLDLDFLMYDAQESIFEGSMTTISVPSTHLNDRDKYWSYGPALEERKTIFKKTCSLKPATDSKCIEDEEVKNSGVAGFFMCVARSVVDVSIFAIQAYSSLFGIY